MTTNSFLQVLNLNKTFSKKPHWFSRKKIVTNAVHNVSFNMKKGRILGLIGESGSGKSTLALSLAGLYPLSSGAITFQNKTISTSNKNSLSFLRQHIRMVFQDPQASLNPRKTILSNLGHFLIYHKLVSNKNDLISIVGQKLELVGLSSKYLHAFPHQLSGGQLQRASIARALLGNPSLIICDEILSSLDLSMQAQILNMLQQLHKNLNLNYFFISHDLSVVRSFCHDVIIMYKGQIVEMGPTDVIFHQPKHPYTQMLLDSQLAETPLEKKERSFNHINPISNESKSSTCVFYNRCPFRKEQCAHNAIPKKTIISQSYQCIL